MGIVREPDGVEFTVLPTKLTARDRREISEFIAEDRRKNDNTECVRESKEILKRYEERQQAKNTVANPGESGIKDGLS